jgi:ribosome-associated toxin RatA of RatAB toxin-antitoxin module
MPAPLLRLGFALVLLLAWQARAAEVVVHASRQGDVLHVEASAEFEADVRKTWQVLTDYEHLPDFIPGMHLSRVVARDGDGLVVEQNGEARLLFFSYPIRVRLAVEEIPYTRINARAVAGNFRQMVGVYYLSAGGRHVTLRYSGRMIPDFFVPPLIGTLVLRRNVERQFGALVDEIVRRQQVPPPASSRPAS